MSNKIDLTQFNQTKVIKKLTKSKSNEDLKNIIEEEPKIENAIAASSNASFDTRKTREAVTKRGRKSKYMSQEERLEARRLQQKEYRLRKKQELEELKKIAATVLTNKE